MATFLHAYQLVILPLFVEAISLDNVGSTSLAPPKKDLPKRSMIPEDQVRLAALSCLEYWCDPGNDEGERGLDAGATVPTAIHKECLVTPMLEKSTGGQSASIEGSSFRVPLLKTSTGAVRLHSYPSSLVHEDERCQQERNPTVQKNIVSVKILPVGPRNAASVQVQIVADNSNITIHGFLTFLNSQLVGWTCISAAFSDTTGPILPSHFQSVTQLTWEGYCGANRACDGAAMAKVFHPDCRLTYVDHGYDKEDDIAIWSQAAFCDKVQNRYTNQAMHQPFASLQSHSNIGVYDSLQAIEFVTPNLCMVTLQVGHPPCLWTDLLTCGFLVSDTDIGWWILHKSSCHEEFELTDDMKAVLGRQKASTCTLADDAAATIS
jgi:hypothetical protein